MNNLDNAKISCECGSDAAANGAGAAKDGANCGSSEPQSGSRRGMNILVVGLGRCGSSLVMQMLQSAGIECLGDYPAFEPGEVGFSRRPHLLMGCLSGRAAKILDPHRDIEQWPDQIHARAIWLDRDQREQAKSQVKFLQMVGGIDVPGKAWRAIRSGLVSDRRKCESWLDRCEAILSLRFEDILRDPHAAARAICDFLRIPKSRANVMAERVIQRAPKCQPGMDIEISLLSRTTEAPHA